MPASPPFTLSHCPSHPLSPPGRDLPLCAQLFKYASWMGGDRDGNPAVTSLVTSHVVYLARWMAADMYLREIDALHFEVREERARGDMLGSVLYNARRQRAIKHC